MKSLIFILGFLAGYTLADDPCYQIKFNQSSFVCACNATYCDTYGRVQDLIKPESVLVVTSDKDSQRLDVQYVDFTTNEDSTRIQFILDETQMYQEILGFGGAFTDSAAFNMYDMDTETMDKILASYFDPSGLDYSIGRVNMGGCDFSTRTYTYVDTPGDVALETFELQEEDYLKIALIKQANTFRPQNTSLKMYASPWTAPPWMKSNNDYAGQGYLLPEYYQAWADYFVKFLNVYKEEDISFWGLTAQNEPWDGLVPNFTFNAMAWNATSQRVWITDNLGPSLEAAGYADLKVMVLDDQRPMVPKWAREVFSDPRALKYVSGIGVHWYVDEVFPVPFALDQAHEEFPDKFLLYTEACTGDRPWELEKVMLGDWNRGERYINNIIEDLNHWVVGWTDWNLVLDRQGGPNWAGNFVDAPIIVDPSKGEFYKQPMYFAMAHISRFITPGSVRIQLSHTDTAIQAVAVLRPDSTVAVVLLNKNSTERKVTLRTSRGDLNLDLGPRSFTSVAFSMTSVPSIHILH